MYIPAKLIITQTNTCISALIQERQIHPHMHTPTHTHKHIHSLIHSLIQLITL